MLYFLVSIWRIVALAVQIVAFCGSALSFELIYPLYPSEEVVCRSSFVFEIVQII